jgi:hypothetical protein
MLRFQLASPEGDELEMHLDKEGLESLLAQLLFLRDRKTDHLHLMSEAWGGTHLEAGSTEQGAIHHVKIMMVQ